MPVGEGIFHLTRLCSGSQTPVQVHTESFSQISRILSRTKPLPKPRILIDG